VLLAIRRFFARIGAMIIGVVTLRLLDVNPTGKPTAMDQDRDPTQTGQTHDPAGPNDGR
jgi:hypothetical protein